MEVELFQIVCFIAFMSAVNGASMSDLQAAPFARALQDLGTGIGVDFVQQKYDELPYEINELDGQNLINELAQQVRAKFRNKIEIAKGLRDAIEQQYSTFTSDTDIKQCCHLSDYLGYEPRFKAKIDYNSSCYHVSESSIPNPKKISTEIVKLMKENHERDPYLRWQYFCTEEGAYFNYPAFKFSSCTEYDGRFRPYYVEAAVPKPNDVVIVIDKSGSMGGLHNGKTLMSIAIDATKTVIGTLNPRDRVGLVTFSTSAETPPGNPDIGNCYASQLALATPQNIDSFKSYLDDVSYAGSTNYLAALDKAFDLFLQTPSLGDEREKVMLFMTDGVPNDVVTLEEILSKIHSKNQQLDNKVIIMTYGLGISLDGKAETILEQMKDQTGYNVSHGPVTPGKYTQVRDPSNLRVAMASYYNFFSTRLEDNANPIFTIPYVDAFNKLLISSIVLPVYHEGQLKGVVGTDITIGEVLSEVTFFKFGEFSYAFMIDGSGRTLMHPLLPRPYEVSEPPIFINIGNLEPEAAIVTEAMKRGESGSESLKSKRSLARGNSKYEGVNSYSILSHYYYSPIAGTNFSVCVVIADHDRQAQLPRNLQLADSEPFLYHNLTFSKQSARACKFFKRYAMKRSCLKFSPFAFKEPYTYLDNVETQADIDGYEQYMKGGSNNAGFQPGVRPAVAIATALEEHWLLDMQKNITQFNIWRYFGGIEGVLRFFPAATLAKTYDHTIRPWYKRTVAYRGMNVLTTPYEDVWGSGQVVTYTHTIYQGKADGKHPSNDLIAGVMGTDFTLGSFYSKMLEANPVCSDENFRCFVMDSSGYLVMHPDFVETDDVKKITNIHIIDKIPSAANHLISDGVLKREACVNYENIVFNAYWRMDLISRYENDQVVVEYVENSNVYVGIYSTQLSTSVSCVCKNEHDRCFNQDLSSSNKACECPCYTQANYNYCENKFLENSESWATCTPRTPEPEYSIEQEQSKIENLPRCFDKKCHERTDKKNCFGVSGCRWCTREVCLYQEEACLDIVCGNPGLNNNSVMTGSAGSYYYLHTVSYRCDAGYELTDGDFTLTCQANKQWNGSAPVCNKVVCADPGNVARATRTGSIHGFEYGDRVVYACDTGYYATSGNPVRVCTQLKTWSGAPPVCNIVNCENPGEVVDAMKVGSAYMYQAEINYICSPGFQVQSGNLLRRCLENGTWSGSQPFCDRTKERYGNNIQNSGDLDAGVIAGIFLGAAAFVSVFILILVTICRNHLKSQGRPTTADRLTITSSRQSLHSNATYPGNPLKEAYQSHLNLRPGNESPAFLENVCTVGNVPAEANQPLPQCLNQMVDHPEQFTQQLCPHCLEKQSVQYRVHHSCQRQISNYENDSPVPKVEYNPESEHTSEIYMQVDI